MRREKVTVSAIITTFNRSSLLLRALNSVFSQSHLADEVIVIDDGSTDHTAQQVREKFPQVRYFWQENKGVSAARNHGIWEAKGQWLTFLDSDDEWRPKKLEKQLKALQDNPQYRICYTDEIWIRCGRRVNSMKKHAKYGGYVFKQCLPLCIISPSSVILHRSVFEKVGLFDDSLPVCEDYDLWLRTCALYPVLYLDEPLIVKYGGHADQMSYKYWGMDRFRVQSLEKIIRFAKLSPDNLRAAIKMLIEKIDIYLQGAQKRGKWEEAAEYKKKKDSYLTFYHHLYL